MENLPFAWRKGSIVDLVSQLRWQDLYLCTVNVLIEQSLHKNVPLWRLLNEETLFKFWQRFSIKEVNNLAPSMAKISNYMPWACNLQQPTLFVLFSSCGKNKTGNLFFSTTTYNIIRRPTRAELWHFKSLVKKFKIQ